MIEILVPRPGLEPLDRTGLRMSWWDKVSYVARSLEQCGELVRFFGAADFCPLRPVLLLFPTGEHAVVDGAGYTSAAELQDLCVVTWGRYLDRMTVNGGRIFDFDALREQHGIPSFADADAEVRNRLLDYVGWKQRNQRTVPGKRIA
ncbi:MAG TPA: hypothetical protein VGA20_04385 [Gemmatimonadales bacterium]|jgi:hypothetical protein